MRTHRRELGARVGLVLWALASCAGVAGGCQDGGGAGEGADGVAASPGPDPVDVPDPPAPLLPSSQRSRALTFARQVLEAYHGEGRAAALATPLPEAEAGDVDVALVTVSLRVGGRLRGTGDAEEGSFDERVRAATVAAAEDDRSAAGAVDAAEVEDARIELNAGLSPERLVGATAEAIAAGIEPGRHAVRLVHPGGHVSVTETRPLVEAWTTQASLDQLCATAGLDAGCTTDPSVELWRLLGEHWMEDAGPDRGMISLWRTHRRIALGDVTRASVEAAVRLNAGYFVAHQHPAGDFDYLYYPESDGLSEAQVTVRQAGGGYALSRAAAVLDDPAVDGAARASVANILAHEATSAAGLSYIDWQGSSLGLTGLSLLAVAELTSTDEHLEAAARLADGIAAMQGDDGMFRTDYVSDAVDEEAQQFYPGEALLALVRLSARTGETRWLPVLERAYDPYVAFWEAEGKSAFVPWQAATWANLYQLTGEPKYAAFAFRLEDALLERQDLVSYGDALHDDWGGTMSRPPGAQPTFSTGTFLEPLPLLVVVARAVGDDARADHYADRLRHGLRFTLQLVITEPEAWFAPDPARALGGVRSTLDDVHVRIDNVQHVATAFLQALSTTADEARVWGEP